MKAALLSLFTGRAVEDDERHTLDHVVPKSRPVDDPAKSPERRRAEALIRAAQRHGKPFACGPEHLPREHYVAPGVTATLLPRQRGSACTTLALSLAILVYTLMYAPLFAAFIAKHGDTVKFAAECVTGFLIALAAVASLYTWVHTPRRKR